MATVMANTLYKCSGSLNMTKIKMGKAMLAKIELKETQRVMYNTSIKIAMQHKATFG